MVKKRARLSEDNDPLSSTDKVLAGFEELSKSTEGADKSGSQEVEDKEVNKTNKSNSRQVKKSTSQPASKSAIRASRRKKTSPSNTSKQSQQNNKLSSQQDKQKTSQEVNQNLKSNKSDKSASHQDENIVNQEVAEKRDSVPTAEEFKKLASQQDKNIESQEVAEKKDSVHAAEQSSKSESQQASNKESQEVEQNQKSDDKLASQQVNKLVVRKSTFQLDYTILKQLDRLHLELQLELGKQNAPYKEVIVEEAISQLLEVAAENRSGLVERLLERQARRN